MTGLETLLKDFWAVLIALLSGLIWLNRLESRVNGNQRDISRIEARQSEDRANARAERAHLDAKLGAIQDDIKQLIRATGEK